jgi:hypothetical protein
MKHGVQTVAVSTQGCWNAFFGCLVLPFILLPCVSLFEGSMQTSLQTLPNERTAGYSASYTSNSGSKRKIALYVKKENDPDFSKVLMPVEGDISDLRDLIKAKLQIQEPPNHITLRKQQEKGKMGPMLQSRMTVKAAGLQEKDALIVELFGSAGGEAGVCSLSLVSRQRQSFASSSICF